MSSPLEIVILAAGKGSRMYSDLPKVLHPLADKPLLQHVIETGLSLNPIKTHVIYGHGGDAVPTAMSEYDIEWVCQREQLGTGHAVEQALPGLSQDSTVLILYGDVPLTDPATLTDLVALSNDQHLALLTVDLADPHGYGRIVRNSEMRVERIVEQKDASETELAICEVNSGIMALPAKMLHEYIARLENNNAQGEFYLTDLIALAVSDGHEVIGHVTRDEDGVAGVNNRHQLAHLERVYQQRQVESLMDQGVTVIDPARVDIRGTVSVGRDVFLDVGVILKGEVTLGDGVVVGANTIIEDSRLAEGVVVEPMSLIQQAQIDAHCSVGPFARIRPNTHLHEGAKIGNFVEIKKSEVGPGSKVSHLSYIGDTEMGSGVNIGAGTITCNYDGANKHKTTLGNDVFVGSATQLVAPVSVGNNATIGAGSTITKDVADDQLTLTRVSQKSLSGWERPKKKS